MVTKGSALILSHNIKQLALWHFKELIYECLETVGRRCSKESYNLGQNIQRLSGFGIASLLNSRNIARFLFTIDGVPKLPNKLPHGKSLKILGNYEISLKSQKSLELKRSAKLATRNKHFGNYARKLQKKNYL